jgi:hypothetical protein
MAPIPMLFGTMRAAGNVIFCTDKREVPNEQEQGGKGGPKVTTTTYTYNVDMAIALCEGPIVGIRKIWSNGKLVYDASEDASATSRWPAASTRKAGRSISATKTSCPTRPSKRRSARATCPPIAAPPTSCSITSIARTADPAAVLRDRRQRQQRAVEHHLRASPGARLRPYSRSRPSSKTACGSSSGTTGAQPVYSAGPGWYSNEGVRLFSTPDRRRPGADLRARRTVCDVSLVRARAVVRNPVEPDRRQSGDRRPRALRSCTSPGVEQLAGAGIRAPMTRSRGLLRGQRRQFSAGHPRSASITIFSSSALTDVLMTPSTPMAFYNSVIYTCGTEQRARRSSTPTIRAAR